MSVSVNPLPIVLNEKHLKKTCTTSCGLQEVAVTTRLVFVSQRPAESMPLSREEGEMAGKDEREKNKGWGEK